MPAEILLVVNVLPENDPKAQAAIQVLKHSSADVQVLHAYEQNFRPCVGCNARRNLRLPDFSGGSACVGHKRGIQQKRMRNFSHSS